MNHYPKLKVFLCHSKNDKSKVREYYRKLVDDGFDAWLDDEKLIAGQDWDLEIRKAIRESDIVVVFLSNVAITKAGYVQKEIRTALDVADEQPEGRIFLIPARLEECDPPERLQRLQWVNLFEDNGYINLVKSLNLQANNNNTNKRRKEIINSDRERINKVRDISNIGHVISGYQDLDRITMDEIRDAYNFFQNQLIPTPIGSWIEPNQFCLLDLNQTLKSYPRVIFGRVKSCYPNNGYIQNIEQIELLVPQKYHPPISVLLYAKDIIQPPLGNTSNYCVRVKFYASFEDISEFNSYESSFSERGFALEFNTGYIDLLEMSETNKDSYPWFYLVGSRWLASIPDYMMPEVRFKLSQLIQWNKIIFNNHPKSLAHEIKTLNRELGLKVGFTSSSIIEPEGAIQALMILSAKFNEIYQRPLSDWP